MYKVLIVDDEYLVRNYVSSLLDWEQLGFSICGEAGNGQEALKQIAKLAPDLVIMDIHMPVMDGVELSEQIAKQYPHIHMYALSGYDDYPYVRETLRNGAMDYLLKDSLDKPFLHKLIEQARGRLELDSKERTERQSEKFRVEKLKELAFEKILRELLIGNEAYDSAQVHGLGVPLSEVCQGGYVAAVMQISRYSAEHGGKTDAEKDQVIRSIQMLCKQALESTEQPLTYLMCYMEEGRFGFVLPFHGMNSEAALQQVLSQQTGKISYMLNQYLNAQVVWGFSSKSHQMEKLSHCYREALRATSVSMSPGTDELTTKVNTLSIRQELELLKALEGNDSGRTAEVIEEVFAPIPRAADHTSLQLLVNDLMMIAVKVSSEKSLDTQKIYEAQTLTSMSKQHGDAVGDVKQSIHFVFKTLIEELVQRTAPEGCSEHCKRAIEYIQLNYHKELTLTDLAEMLGLSPAYFSRVFRKETGFGFIEYLNKLRIDKAKQRMRNGDHHVKRISQEVGFNSYSHFFKLFKEMTGSTPAGFLGERGEGGDN
ncbi:response regulator [Paenibacillus hexagrammi]|uniref:Response regulator n=1 Tax=Paenibacillus hexagrammi TaxID=2908839 RepID=A0ABY3SNZ4_9BACL|nr:response regulator [Paenibacillus sp. YPD9-1]UJF34816.1 response regulator [Paenibacillus sp. YPD9-1]